MQMFKTKPHGNCLLSRYDNGNIVACLLVAKFKVAPFRSLTSDLNYVQFYFFLV